ncbi:MAG: hypothetical protein ACMG57_04770 [Candidatus Dojkabacteria bacterium]
MFFDIDLLKNLYKLDDTEDIEKEYSKYMLRCIVLAEVALVAFDLQKLPSDLDFEEDRANLTVEMEGEIEDLDYPLELITKLRDNEGFEIIYSDLLENLNEELISAASATDPEAKNRVDKYLENLENSMTVDYANLVVKPEIEDYEDELQKKKIEKMNVDIDEAINSVAAPDTTQ